MLRRRLLNDDVDATEVSEPRQCRQSLTGFGPKVRYSIAAYANPNASDAAAPADMAMTKPEMAEAASGLVYLLFTLVLSLYYLRQLTPVMANDLWWAHCNVSGAQTYLIDVVNARLNIDDNVTNFDLAATGSLTDYSTYFTPVLVTPVYARTVVASQVTNLSAIIQVLYDSSSPHNVLTQYCWVDLNRTWEVAHTNKRQKRCADRYADNGAMYWETHCRLVNWRGWMIEYGDKFDQLYGQAMKLSEAGRRWFNQTSNAFKSVESEVVYWRQHGLTRYMLPLYNDNVFAVDEKIHVTNAIGSTQSITIKRIAKKSNVAWSTFILTWGPWNEHILYYTQVRSHPDHSRFLAPCSYDDYLVDPDNYECWPCDAPWNPDPANCVMDTESVLLIPPTPLYAITRANIGPYGAMDLFFVSKPESLSAVFNAFSAVAMSELKSNRDFRDAMLNIPNFRVDPVPTAWHADDLFFMGGDPTCPSREPKPFVQSSIAFDVSCSVQERHTMLLHKFNALFAILALHSTLPSLGLDHVCGQCPTLAGPCNTVVDATTTALSLLLTAQTWDDDYFRRLFRDAQRDVVALGVMTMQYAVTGSDSFLLTNSLLRPLTSDESDNWAFFGWVYLFEWAEMSREVLSLEGDYASLRLVSDKYSPITNEAQKLEVPQSSSKYLYVVSVVVSAILLSAGTIMAVYAVVLRGRIVGRNLFQFNRIVGAVWLGRPFLLVRGMTAVIILSTAPLRFVSRHGVSSFEFQPRSVAESMLVAGEATWITYVLNDFLLLLTRNSQPHFAPMSTCLGWLILLILDVFQPTQAVTNLNRECSIDMITAKISCMSGQVQLGDVQRAFTFVLIQVVCVVVSYVVVTAWQCCASHTSPRTINSHLLLSGTATAFLHSDLVEHGSWQIDHTSCVMCGLLVVRDFIFDLKLWSLVHQPNACQAKWNMKVFAPPDMNMVVPSMKDLSKAKMGSLKPPKTKKVNPTIIRLFAVAGLGYMCATIFGSVTYLSLTQINMANDFFWANYNSSREHVYVARLFNRELVLQPSQGRIDLTNRSFVDSGNFNLSTAFVPSVEMRRAYVSRVQNDESSKLVTIIRGLRSMDACLAPWISTQYCYVDFPKRWEMANTAARQARCAARYATNGAVYLETVLRNVQWTKLETCWKTSLDIAVKSALLTSKDGAAWWAAVQAVHTSDAAEAATWVSHGISAFTTDWQNYKTVGIIDTFDVENAFGLAYSMTLKHTNGTFRLASQTSMKMYWSFASDLWAVTDPANVIFGKSLVRQSSAFAFSNVSIEAVLIQNGTIHASAISRGSLGSFRDHIGPFGSVDLKAIPAPASLIALVSDVRNTLTQMQAQSATFSKHLNWIGYFDSVGFMPAPWVAGTGDVYSIGGNVLCDEMPADSLRSGLRILTGATTSCTNGLGEFIYPSSIGSFLAVLGANSTRPRGTNETRANMDEDVNICRNAFGMRLQDCVWYLVTIPRAFLTNTTHFPDPGVVSRFQRLAATAKADVRAATVELAQFVRYGEHPEVHVLRHALFDDALPSFDYFAWHLVYDWALAFREVIAMEGDVGTIHVLTTRSNDIGSLVNPLEIPVNVASYIRYACLYITCVVICVAVLATMYLIACNGYVEGLNLLEINRVAGIVWIGRTILLVRSLSAIGMLSTEVLSLEGSHGLWGFRAQRESQLETGVDHAVRMFKMLLAAGEVSWLGFVLNDFLMVVTQQYTTAYVFKCNFMIWGISAVLSLALPATHTATIDRQCEIPQVDFQLVCRNGTIAIGSFRRFATLVGVCVGSTCLCYLYERLRRPELKPTQPDSFFLAASAKYVYDPVKWMDNQTYFIDPASAVINGLLSVRVSNTFYIFDLKIWRLFVIEEPKEMRRRKEAEGAWHLMSAIPLTD